MNIWTKLPYVGLISISLRENLTFYQNPSKAKVRFEGSTKNRILVLSEVWVGGPANLGVLS